MCRVWKGECTRCHANVCLLYAVSMLRDVTFLRRAVCRWKFRCAYSGGDEFIVAAASFDVLSSQMSDPPIDRDAILSRADTAT